MKKKRTVCEFNEGVKCSQDGGCAKCGWNPTVARRRVYAIKAKRSERPVKES